ILIYAGNYRPELTAFFANTVAATQASNIPRYAKGQRVHYLRTLNPFNPENLSVYPNRIGSNRTNPYQMTRASLSFRELLTGGTGPLSYETRHCANGVPTLVNDAVLDPLGGVPLIGEELESRIKEFAFTNFSSGEVAAPPCVQQPNFTPNTKPKSADDSQFPHVSEALNGQSTRSKGE
ncbi:MAG: hypothetical protein ABIO51_05745, partial [Solirubrobacteraceae bacterium]